MQKIIAIFLYCTLFSTSVLGQERNETKKYQLVLFQDAYNVLGIKNLINDKKEIEGVGLTTTTKIGVFTNDSILLYSLNEDKSLGDSILFTLKKENFDAENEITLDAGGATLDIIFKNKNVIKVNDDSYLLNTAYYNYLKTKILHQKSILDLRDLLRDHLGDYPDNLELLTNNCFPYKNNLTHRILSINLTTHRYQAPDYVDRWTVKYKYDNKAGLVNVQKKNSDGTIGFEKTFVAKNKAWNIYSLNRNIEDRAISNDTIFRNTISKTDSIVSDYIQNPRGIEICSTTYPLLRKTYSLDKFSYGEGDLLDITRKDVEKLK